MADDSKPQKAIGRKLISQERLREMLRYDPATGIFTWLIAPGKRADLVGRAAGTPHNEGYVAITIDGGRYLAHRLAIFYVSGEWPPSDVDHRHRERRTARFDELRCATRSQNNANSPAHRNSGTGARGVHFHKGAGRFRAQIRNNGKYVSLGYFDTIEEASAAYMRAAKEIYGEFAHA